MRLKYKAGAQSGQIFNQSPDFLIFTVTVYLTKMIHTIAVIFVLSTGLIIIQTYVPIYGQILQSLINQNQANQSYRAELESYIQSNYVSSPRPDGTVSNVTLTSALEDNESPH